LCHRGATTFVTALTEEKDMRAAAGFLTVLCTGVLSQALATEPAPPSPSPSQTPPAPASQQTATAQSSEHGAATPAGTQNAVTPAVGSTPAKPAVTPNASEAEAIRKEHELISRGYKVEMRHGEKYFCRRETELGSHFEMKSCNTAESILAKQANSQETVRAMQAIKPEISN
jgi:hypothetical protein